MTEITQAVGNVVKGAASFEAGKFNRQAAQVEAVNDLNAGAAAEARIRDGARQVIGEQIAAQGANGFQQGTGSAVDALTQSQVNAAMDALNARQAAASRARSARVQGDIAYAEGQNAMTQGMIGAASDAVRYRSDWAAARAPYSGGD